MWIFPEDNWSVLLGSIEKKFDSLHHGNIVHSLPLKVRSRGLNTWWVGIFASSSTLERDIDYSHR